MSVFVQHNRWWFFDLDELLSDSIKLFYTLTDILIRTHSPCRMSMSSRFCNSSLSGTLTHWHKHPFSVIVSGYVPLISCQSCQSRGRCLLSQQIQPLISDYLRAAQWQLLWQLWQFTWGPVNDSLYDSCDSLPEGRSPMDFITTWSSWKDSTPSSSLSNNMNTSFQSATWRYDMPLFLHINKYIRIIIYIYPLL